MSNLRETVFVVSADRLVRAAVEQVLAAQRMHPYPHEMGAQRSDAFVHGVFSAIGSRDDHPSWGGSIDA